MPWILQELVFEFTRSISPRQGGTSGVRLSDVTQLLKYLSSSRSSTQFGIRHTFDVNCSILITVQFYDVRENFLFRQNIMAVQFKTLQSKHGVLNRYYMFLFVLNCYRRTKRLSWSLTIRFIWLCKNDNDIQQICLCRRKRMTYYNMHISTMA